MKDRLSVAIIGGGVGGLAIALSLLRDGIDAHVPLGELVETTFGAPYYHLHRADLLHALASKLPPQNLHLGQRLTNLVDAGDSVQAAFESGARVKADVLVGADGIHSAVRRSVFGPERPNFTGCAAYRGLVPAERLAHLNLETTTEIWMGPGKHFVHYFVRSRRLVNFVAVLEQDTWTHESWTDRADPLDALAAFQGWHSQVREILQAADQTFIWALFDRKPMTHWAARRVTLLGDACHAMLPFMSQGAAQSIEDGATLAACLSGIESGQVCTALRRYEALRIPRASHVQSLSGNNKQRFHLLDGPAQEQRDAAMASGTTDWSLQAIAWLYAHDASKLDDSERGSRQST